MAAVNMGFSKRRKLYSNGRVELINLLCFAFMIMFGLGICMVLPSTQLSTSLYYCGVIISATFFASLSEKARTRIGFSVLFGMSFLILFFTYGFRDSSGIDDPAYIGIFQHVVNQGWWRVFLTTTMEPGYLILNDVVATFTHDYFYLQLITSFIPLVLFYRGFSKYRDIISLPVSVFLLSTMLYFQMLGVALVRMFIAISIVFNGFYYIPKKKGRTYVLLVLVASLFHYSALFMLILTYFTIDQENMSRRAKRFVTLAFLGIPISFIFIARFVVPLLGSRYSEYGNIGSFSLDVSSFDTIPLLVLLLMNMKRIPERNLNQYRLLLAIFALSSIMSIYSSMILLGRLIYYANSAFFVASGMMVKSLERSTVKLLFYGIILVYGFVYVYWTQFSLAAHIPYLFPYRNIFFTM